jgi:hypothetical protein
MEVRNPCNDAGVSTRIAHDIVLIASEVVIDIDLRLSLNQSRKRDATEGKRARYRVGAVEPIRYGLEI